MRKEQMARSEKVPRRAAARRPFGRPIRLETKSTLSKTRKNNLPGINEVTVHPVFPVSAAALTESRFIDKTRSDRTLLDARRWRQSLGKISEFQVMTLGTSEI